MKSWGSVDLTEDRKFSENIRVIKKNSSKLSTSELFPLSYKYHGLNAFDLDSETLELYEQFYDFIFCDCCGNLITEEVLLPWYSNGVNTGKQSLCRDCLVGFNESLSLNNNLYKEIFRPILNIEDTISIKNLYGTISTEIIENTSDSYLSELRRLLINMNLNSKLRSLNLRLSELTRVTELISNIVNRS